MLVISNQYEAVVAELPSTSVSLTDFMQCLVPCASYPLRSTLLSEVSVLIANEELRATNGAIEIKQPRDRSWVLSHDAPTTEPHNFLSFFDNLLNDFIASRLEGQAFAFQVSGGLDSSTLPMFMSRNYAHKPIMETIVYSFDA